jgi:peroxiredoxin
MKAFQQNISKLEAANTQVLGVSMDSPFANFNFAQQNGITFPLLSDRNGSVVKEYGLEKEYAPAGVKMMSARRATFLIDKSGKVIEEQVDTEALDPSKVVEACERQKLKG